MCQPSIFQAKMKKLRIVNWHNFLRFNQRFFIAISEINPPLIPGSSGKMHELADYEQKESNPPTLKTSFILKRWGRAILCYYVIYRQLYSIHTMEVHIHVCVVPKTGLMHHF
jgi:hypothetical protein